MDARVKGIRRLSVVYYNFIDPNVAFELMEAASIMGIPYASESNSKQYITENILNLFGRLEDLLGLTA